MEARCRLCATDGADLGSVLKDHELLETIQRFFQVWISADDVLPTNVCSMCRSVINCTREFHERVQNAQRLLTEISETAKVVKNALEVSDIAADVTTDGAEMSPQTGNKRKTRKCKSVVKNHEEDLSKILDLEQCEHHEDGSVTPRTSVEGWSEYSWQCCECLHSYSSADELREHFATAHKQPARFSCNECPKVYSKYNMFIGHVRFHKPMLRFSCDICFKWFLTVRQQDRHRSEHGDGRSHGCLTCGKRFRMHSALLVHSRSHLPAEMKNCYQCDLCPKRFGTRPNLMAHKRIHEGVRDYTCDQCGKSFVQKGNLDNHLLTHTVTRPFSCSECGKSFKTSIRLRKHSAVHSDLKPFTCDVCGRQFRERGTLKEHHRIHTGAMPFTCEYCGKNFRFKGVLTTHRRQHTGERPYSCLECQHHFTNWPNYNKHMKRRHGINTSVTVRKPQTIPPTGMPQRNPPGSVLAPPQLPQTYVEQPQFYLNMYNLSDNFIQQHV